MPACRDAPADRCLHRLMHLVLKRWGSQGERAQMQEVGAAIRQHAILMKTADNSKKQSALDSQKRVYDLIDRLGPQPGREVAKQEVKREAKQEVKHEEVKQEVKQEMKPS